PNERNEGTLSEPHRASARHARPVDLADAAMGSPARLRHQRGYPLSLGRDPASGYRLPVSRAAPPRKAEMDCVRVEDFRQQPAREVLPADSTRQEAAGAGAVALGAAARGNRRSTEARRVGTCEVRSGLLATTTRA